VTLKLEAIAGRERTKGPSDIDLKATKPTTIRSIELLDLISM